MIKKIGLLIAVLALIGSTGFGWYYFAEQSFHDTTTPYFARNWVRAELTDPDSAKFRNQKGYCGEVNSKNRMGGYTGFVRFIAITEGLVKFEGSTYTDFKDAWRESCELTLKEWEAEFCKKNPDQVFC